MSEKTSIQIFRRTESHGLLEFMTVGEMSAEQMGGLKKMVDAGYTDGEECRVLVALPGFSLTHAWLKKDYPLLLHTHDSDCLYHITAGSLQMGSESLVAGDSFFVPAGLAYTYRAGPDGVEVLEFRHESHFDFRNLTKNAAFYDKAATTIAAVHSDWLQASKPSEALGATGQ